MMSNVCAECNGSYGAPAHNPYNWCYHEFRPAAPKVENMRFPESYMNAVLPDPKPSQGPQTLADVLCCCAQILNVVKSEWGESWSDWDQSVLEGLTREQQKLYDEGATKPVASPPEK